MEGGVVGIGGVRNFQAGGHRATWNRMASLRLGNGFGTSSNADSRFGRYPSAIPAGFGIAQEDAIAVINLDYSSASSLMS